MLYLVATYWPFMLVALGLGVLVGWWNQDTRADDVAVWLGRGPDKP